MLFEFLFLADVFFGRQFGFKFVGFGPEFALDGFTEFSKFFILLFKEETPDVRTHHCDLKIDSNTVAVFFSHHEKIAVDLFELLESVA